MPSLDFKLEKKLFRQFYDQHLDSLEEAKETFAALARSLLKQVPGLQLSKIEARVKDREECIHKFQSKYLLALEATQQPYTIPEHVTDLIGLRIVCLYEDEVHRVKKVLSEHFEVIDTTDKSASLESTEGEFGYKGLHLDLRLGAARRNLPEYASYADSRVEVQIRTIIQDSWSVLDHQIKYKKSIPGSLKRRINTLAALFELADREFREIRDATAQELAEAESPNAYEELEAEEQPSIPAPRSSETSHDEDGSTPALASAPSATRGQQLDAFGFLRIANHFFNGFEFAPHKVDSFTQEINSFRPGLTRTGFNQSMRTHISTVKDYKKHFELLHPTDAMSPYEVIRHCMYLSDKRSFQHLLGADMRQAFERWLSTQQDAQATA